MEACLDVTRATNREAPLAVVLARVAEHLRRTGARLLQAENAVGRVVLGGVPAGAREISELQALDLALQELAGISAFLAALAEAVPAEWTGDLSAAQATLGLDALVAGLAGGAPAHRGDEYESFD